MKRKLNASVNKDKQIQELLVEHAFLSLKIENLERDIKGQRKEFDDMKFEYDT